MRLLSERSEASSPKSYIKLTLFYERKEDNNCVNIFRKHNYYITHSASMHYKTYCFAFQKWLFCTVKA
ncbi:hypothetical protein CUB97_04815 [Prevotella intermedia]|uniref:Uncharacterized protein n=1 Tax=Prevotella intermedia TaxID=28131 RepID=A0A2M8M8U7_PREIN|nr:hypothetical protein CUB97_04815 [Prevotella intermedia]